VYTDQNWQGETLLWYLRKKLAFTWK
jgi:hypothetical protein